MFGKTIKEDIERRSKPRPGLGGIDYVLLREFSFSYSLSLEARIFLREVLWISNE